MLKNKTAATVSQSTASLCARALDDFVRLEFVCISAIQTELA